MSSQSSKYPTKLQKKGKTVLANKTLDCSVVPRWEADDPIINAKYVGKLKGRPSKETLETKGNLKQRVERYGAEINPVTGYERALSVLMKLEELAMRGDFNSAKEFLNRTMGKTLDNLNIQVSQFAGMSDAELWAEINGNKPLDSENREMIEAEQAERIINSIEIDV